MHSKYLFFSYFSSLYEVWRAKSVKEREIIRRLLVYFDFFSIRRLEQPTTTPAWQMVKNETKLYSHCFEMKFWKLFNVLIGPSSPVFRLLR